MPALAAPPAVRDRLFGLETEYAFAATSPTGERLSGQDAIRRLLAAVRAQRASLPDRRSAGMFLANSSRLYIDSGHPELATPEVHTPTQLVRYVLAGDRILAAAARAVCAENADIASIFLSRANVGYGQWPATWGCHESYGHVVPQAAVAAGIIPHLASRILLTGAGGFNNHSSGLEFMLSPRVEHLTRPSSDRSTSDRGIFHSKLEPLNGRGYHRLHILCGEGLCSETGMWLKAATTALVLAMIDAGIRLGREVTLKNPVAAMRTFSSDPTCRATAPRARDGRPLSALDIQRHYLGHLEKHAGAPFLPEWASEACERWRAALDLVEQGHEAASRTFDWAIKLSLFRRHARRAGFEWSDLPRWNRAVQQLRAAIALHRDKSPHVAPPSLDSDEFTRALLDPCHPMHGALRLAAPALEAEGLHWDGLAPFLKLRDDLWALDSRFSQLGDGVFASLDRAGVLDHHVPGVERIDEAAAAPPAFGRAALRGAAVQRLAGEGKRAACDWEGVWNYADSRLLVLDDPFATAESWIEMPPEFEAPHGEPGILALARADLARLLPLYDAGRYEEGSRILERLAIYGPAVVFSLRQDMNRYTGWFQSRRGFLDGNDALRLRFGDAPQSLSAIADILCARRYQGLRPQKPIDEWFRRADALIAADPQSDALSQATLNGHRGYHLLRRGKPRAAYRCFRDVISSPSFDGVHRHVKSRIFSDMADACRALGWTARAERLLDEAEQIQLSDGFEGDLADHTLTHRAKLAKDPVLALAFLAQALEIQHRLGNRMGEARTRLLQARLTTDRRLRLECKRRVHSLRRQLPALAECDLTDLILRHWTDWTAGKQPARCRDRFWWL